MSETHWPIAEVGKRATPCSCGAQPNVGATMSHGRSWWHVRCPYCRYEVVGAVQMSMGAVVDAWNEKRRRVRPERTPTTIEPPAAPQRAKRGILDYLVSRLFDLGAWWFKRGGLRGRGQKL